MKGKKVGPGEQVASNKAMHCNMQLFEWGKKYAAKVLLENKIAVQQDILYKAEVELSKLQRCLESIQQWSDSEE